MYISRLELIVCFAYLSVAGSSPVTPIVVGIQSTNKGEKNEATSDSDDMLCLSKSFRLLRQ